MNEISMGDWYVTDRAHDNVILRGPFEHEQTAVAIRYEMERSADEHQNSIWNLWIEQRKSRE